MKHKLSFIVALWWIIGCLIAGVFLMGTSDKDGHVSESENRMLQGFPKLTFQSLFSAQFMTEFDAFLSDNFFARDSVIDFTNGALDTFSMLSADDRFAAKTAQMESDLASANLQVEDDASEGEAPAEEAAAEIPGVVDIGAVPEPVEEEDAAEEAVVVNDTDFLINERHSYLWFEMADGSLKTIYTYDKDKIDTYAETLRMMQGYLPDDGMILFTQVPLASIANRWSTQQNEFVGWGSSVEQMLEDSIGNNDRIKVFSTYDLLEPFITGDTPMFYTNDHHWSAEGAYIVCSEMLAAQGMPVIPYEEYKYKAITSEAATDGYHDTFNVLYPLLPTTSLIMTYRDQGREISLMNYDSTTYRSFMNNTRLPWRRIITGANTGRNALVLCDSFGNAFTPYLLGYYNEVHMADFRKGSYSKKEAGGSIGELIQYYNIDDVYIVTSTANGLRKDNSIKYLRQYLVS